MRGERDASEQNEGGTQNRIIVMHHETLCNSSKMFSECGDGEYFCKNSETLTIFLIVTIVRADYES